MNRAVDWPRAALQAAPRAAARALNRAAALTVLLVCTSGPVWAQPAAPDPDAKAMIEALKPPVTRSLRNLVVRPVAQPGSSPEATPPAPPAASGAGADAVPAAAVPASTTGAPSIALAIRFDFDSARIRPESLPLLATLAQAIRSPELATSRFLVEGHTDGRGSAAYNLRLSQARAAEVERVLVSQGVGADRLRSVGRGATAPANASDPGASENRRVRVVNLE